MSDGKGVAGAAIEGVEEVAKAVGNSIGEVADEVLTSVVRGPQQTKTQNSGQTIPPPAKTQQEIAQANEVRRRLQWLGNEQRLVQQANRQKEMDRRQTEAQEEQKAQQVKQFKTQPIQNGPGEALLRTRTELKAGRGVGG